MDLPNIAFLILAACAVLCGGGVLAARHPLAGAVSLVGTMVAIAGIYGLLDAPYLAVIQLLVYAGAIMMLLVFVIMMLNVERGAEGPRSDLLAIPATAVGMGFALAVVWVLAAGAFANHPDHAQPGAVGGTIEALGRELFTVGPDHGWWLLFQVVSVALLTALAGAVVLAMRPQVPAAEETP